MAKVNYADSPALDQEALLSAVAGSKVASVGQNASIPQVEMAFFDDATAGDIAAARAVAEAAPYSLAFVSQDSESFANHSAVTESLAALAAGNNNNYAGIGARARMARLTPAAAGSALTGLSGGVDGRELVVVNVGVGVTPLTFVNESAMSADVNRIVTGTADLITIRSGGLAQLIYDGTSARWRMI